MSKRNFQIYKAHGGKEYFSKRKLFTSLKRSGLPNRQCQIITDKVSREITEGSKTRDIYKKTLRFLDQSSHVAAVHYSLKKALFDLGPTGHHFETFVAKYFEAIGYTTKTCKLLQGRFVKHEVDVIAVKNGKQTFVECKFHNRMGIKNDIKVALYVKARWDDLREGPDGNGLEAFYLVSNTAFSSDCLTYAKGTNLKLLGVNAPEERSFLDEIKRLNLYPITSLRRLTKLMRMEFLSRNIVLARELVDQTDLLYKMGMSEHDVTELIGEIDLLGNL